MEQASDCARLAEWLADHDDPCPVCAHNLRGVRDPVCPECGAPLRLAVGSENTKLGPWLLALGSFLLALGFDAVTTLLMTVPLLVFNALRVAGVQQGGSGPPASFYAAIALMLALAVLMAIAVYQLLKRRRAWHTLSRRTQWTAAWGMFAGVGLLHLVGGILIFLVIQ